MKEPLDIDAIARRLKETESGFQYRRHVKGEASARTVVCGDCGKRK